MKKFFKVFSLLAVLLFSQSVALLSQKTETPKMVVGIFVDGLQAEHVERMEKYFTPGGFRLFISSGIVVPKVKHIVAAAGKTADIATIMSGTTPAVSGVGGDYFFDRKKNKKTSILFDENYSGIGTSQQYSSHNLVVSTISDELVLNNPYSKIHAVGIDAETVLMLAGHTATSATWFDEYGSKWATTNYYNQGLVQAADEMNYNGKFKELVAEKWTPSASISSYLNPTVAGSKTIPFTYNLSADRKILNHTANANNLVSALAHDILNMEKMGNDSHTDMLLLQFTVIPPKETTAKLRSAEQEDMYIRLDRDLQNLISQIKSKVGEDNVLFFMVGSCLDSHTPTELGNHKIPSGYFNAERSLALLNTYLMALYGNEKWVSGYYNKQFYLNNDLIEKKKLDREDMINKICHFLAEFEGVDIAFSKEDIQNLSDSNLISNQIIKNTYNPKIGGDIVLRLMPGWLEVDNSGNVLGETKRTFRTFPLYLLAKNLKDLKVRKEIKSTDIAPTIADILKISNPNATIGTTIFYKSEYFFNFTE